MSLNPFPNLQEVLDICRGDEAAQNDAKKLEAQNEVYQIKNQRTE